MKSKKIDELDAITILLFLANLFLYEIGFCNLKTIVENGSYNFSLFRIIVYTTANFAKKEKDDNYIYDNYFAM